MKDTWELINENEFALESSLKSLRKNGEESALAEREYRVAKAKLILDLKAKGYPVTLIPDIVKGDENISLLDVKRKIADVTFKANIESINVYKKKSDDLRMMFDKEYSNVK